MKRQRLGGSIFRAQADRLSFGFRLRPFLLGTAATFAYGHAAVAADPVHLGFDGYRPASNDYCISAQSTHSVPQVGFMWRFSPSGTITGGPTTLDLGTVSNIEVFPPSFSDHEKFRAWGSVLGPLVGEKAISNELNTHLNQICGISAVATTATAASITAVAATAAVASITSITAVASITAAAAAVAVASITSITTVASITTAATATTSSAAAGHADTTRQARADVGDGLA
jgi:hypothetical protein